MKDNKWCMENMLVEKLIKWLTLSLQKLLVLLVSSIKKSWSLLSKIFLCSEPLPPATNKIPQRYIGKFIKSATKRYHSSLTSTKESLKTLLMGISSLRIHIIPSSVTEIWDYAFYICSKLIKITISLVCTHHLRSIWTTVWYPILIQ